jgi:glutaredoxin 3
MLSTKDEVLIYSKNWCPYCVRAKDLLSKYGFNNIREVDIELHLDQKDIMIEKTGKITVPQIFIGTKYVGGFDDLVCLLKTERVL